MYIYDHWISKSFFFLKSQYFRSTSNIIQQINETAVGLHVYQKGPNKGGVGYAGVGWVMQGWGGSYRGGVGHKGVRWVMQGWGRSYRGGVGDAGVGWVMLGWGG